VLGCCDCCLCDDLKGVRGVLGGGREISKILSVKAMRYARL